MVMDRATIRDTIRDTGMAQAIMLQDIIGDRTGTAIIATHTGAIDTGATVGGTIINIGSAKLRDGLGRQNPGYHF